MVRGHAKAEAQKKNAAKQSNQKGKEEECSSLNASVRVGSQLDARKAALKFTCPVCKINSPNYKTLHQHFDSKHPKDTVPPESSFTS